MSTKVVHINVLKVRICCPAGIDRSRVEDMENRLKQDVLQEAAQYNNQILVAHENDDFQVVEQWEAVTEVDVQTPLEVYQRAEW